ncbi:hypothetical protein F4777DRAFT_599620 [Nemania sp. FL0916]|nr:hypothetical protein F4777DRAFT_599620 [Nemania sp. FL0916]
MERDSLAHHMMIGSLESDQFVGASSSRPASRAMSASDASVSASSEEELVSNIAPPYLREKTHISASSIRPPIETHLSLIPSSRPSDHATIQEPHILPKEPPPDEATSPTRSNTSVDNLVSSRAPSITTQYWSSVTGRDPSLAAYPYQKPMSSVVRAPYDGYISKQAIDSILGNIRAFTSMRQHSNCPRELRTIVTNGNGPRIAPLRTSQETLQFEMPSLPENYYLITTNDIEKILDIVITGVRGIHDATVKLDGRSLVFSNDAYAKPGLGNRNIILNASALADPAITICLPRPCFSFADGWSEQGSLLPAAKTTYGMAF